MFRFDIEMCDDAMSRRERKGDPEQFADASVMTGEKPI